MEDREKFEEDNYKNNDILKDRANVKSTLTEDMKRKVKENC